ncbi:MAG TPA: hypothetical protein VNO70_13015 [Blastocatellia bacterium]|nr:hypothetical protein [Blastocatellia bacterium]
MNRVLKSISLAVITALLLTSGVAQGRPQHDAAPKAKNQTAAGSPSGNTPGRIAKFTGAKTVGDSNITEDATGNIGIGTTLPTSLLTVNGVIEMLSGGGLKFPDGTVQTTAGLATISRDATLKGDGTPASRLGLQVPLQLSHSAIGTTLTVSNGAVNGHAMRVFGGSGSNGVAVRATGGAGGLGLEASGGQLDGGEAGDGLRAFGGLSNGGNGGTGVVARGGGGYNGGHGIEAFAGFPLGALKGKAGLFHGDVQVNGVLSKAGGSFKIDHPLDPENKYLSHSFVESPDMMNIYNGNITTDHNGIAVVELPDYFEALNRDFRYQLTVVGQFAQAIVAEKVKDNRFTIQTSAPGVEVSWQVTGIRQDAWANQNRIKVEEAKPERERGHYLHPEAFGKEEERGVEWANQPELMREIKQRRLDAEQARPPRN